MSVTPEMIAVALSFLSSLAITFIVVGIQKEKIRRLEKEVDELRTDQKAFVTYTHLSVVIEPMKTSLNSLERDVREILKQVSRPQP